MWCRSSWCGRPAAYDQLGRGPLLRRGACPPPRINSKATRTAPSAMARRPWQASPHAARRSDIRRAPTGSPRAGRVLAGSRTSGRRIAGAASTDGHQQDQALRRQQPWHDGRQRVGHGAAGRGKCRNTCCQPSAAGGKWLAVEIRPATARRRLPRSEARRCSEPAGTDAGDRPIGSRAAPSLEHCARHRRFELPHHPRSFPLAVPRPGVLSILALTSSVAPGHPDVADAQIGSCGLISESAVPGHQAYDQDHRPARVPMTEPPKVKPRSASPSRR